jgi:hypothetical protein
VVGETGVEFIGDLASARLPQQLRRQLHLSRLLRSFMMKKASTDSCEFAALRNNDSLAAKEEERSTRADAKPLLSLAQFANCLPASARRDRFRRRWAQSSGTPADLSQPW